ncbi:MAG: Hint domain-containing protein [Roseobacter sp.]|jgi:hypothetical protein|nr:Hint domain-containing protein [Roseobacter sp.]
MANYDIYVLGEDNLAISDGGQLDGVTQGDGSHLEGLTITLMSNNWQPIAIVDSDNNFADNDNSQRLDGDQMVNGVPYNDNMIVEAEYGITVTDGTHTWTMVGFNVRDSPTSYATVEGLALLDSPQGPPPVGVALTVTGSFEGPSFKQSDYAHPVCFVTGTEIDTPDGPVPVERISPGMHVQTRDHGVQPVLWKGYRHVIGRNAFAPVRLPAGFADNTRPVHVSQQHKVLLTDWRADLWFGSSDVLVPAKFLVGFGGVTCKTMGPVGYHHLLLAEHAVLRSHSIWSESFFAGPQAMTSLLPEAHNQIATQFPELIGKQSDYFTLKAFEKSVLRTVA